MSSIKHVAIYGKGGIGKSCTASNIAAACADEGHRVLVVGCDPKSDSSITLVGRRIPTMMDLIQRGGEIKEKDVVFSGYKGVKCIEVGGPEPGVGCAGRGIIDQKPVEVLLPGRLASCTLADRNQIGAFICAIEDQINRPGPLSAAPIQALARARAVTLDICEVL